MRLLLMLTIALSALTASAAPQIELWKEGKVLTFVDREEGTGRFRQEPATIRLESWNDGSEQSVWVVRNADGEFVTRYTGTLEHFNFGNDTETQVLVFRNDDGQFITWKPVDDLFTSGFENWADRGWVYVVRYNGQFVNWAPAQFENWDSYDSPVLVVRDTSDDKNNGQIMTWVAPEMIAGVGVRYRNENGQFITATKSN